MPRLSWSAVGERFYEVGVDRGVLYSTGDNGYVWNGLVSITEEPVGGEPKQYYQDGVNYINVVSAEEFAATIEAYTYPEEFGQHDGTAAVKNGLFATQQARRPFGLSYRTRLGNDLLGADYGYQIHLVYNALAKPTQRSRNTLKDDGEPGLFSWSIITKAPTIIGYKPTAHFVIDSTETPEPLLAQVEDLLYGTAQSSPTLPTVAALIDMFNNYVPPVGPPPTPGDGTGTPTTDPSVIFDGGSPTSVSTTIYDGGPVTTSTAVLILDGGRP